MMRALTLALPLLVAAAPSAMAQTRHDSSAPIDVDSDHAELDDRAHRATLSGNVRIRQAEMTLTAARATAILNGQVTNGSPEIVRLDASGGVTVTRPNQSARAQYGVYDVNRRVITMIGGVTLRQGGNNISGQRLTINLDTGRATINGSGVPSSSATPGAPGVQSSGGRVTGRFSVPRRSGGDATPAPQ